MNIENNIIWKRLFLWLTAFASAGALLCWLVSFIPPTEGYFWGIVALATPLVLIANGVIGVGWLIARRWRIALIPLVALGINFGYVASMIQFGWHSNNAPYDLRVATLNTANFANQGEDRRMETLDQIVRFGQQEKVDLFCMQEFTGYSKVALDTLAMGVRAIYPYVVYGDGIAIASRYPIVNYTFKKFANSGNDFMRGDVLVGEDTVSVFTAHLQTSGISGLRYHYEHQLQQDVPLTEVVKSLEKNNRMRANQVWEMRMKIDSTKHPVILLGDFNDTPSSYTYRRMKGDLRDGFRDAGEGFGASFRGMKGVLRIDYIFYDDQLECVKYRTLEENLSDHKMVVADLKFRSSEKRR